MNEILPYIPEQADIDRINCGLEEYNLSSGAPPHIKKLIAFKFCENDKILGDITAEMLMGQLQVQKFLVDKEARGHGIGKVLLQKVEEYASEQSCINIVVSTHTWQAENFYKKQGYQEIGRQKVATPGCFDGQQQYKIYFCKNL